MMRAARSWAVRLDGSLRFSGRSAAQWVRIRARRGSRGCPGEARNGRWFGRAAGGKRVRIGHKIDMEDICAGEWCTVAMAQALSGPAYEEGTRALWVLRRTPAPWLGVSLRDRRGGQFGG